ncbi:MAG: acetyl-CoA acetyltransferase [Pseudomonadota bacterium]
MTTNLSLLRGSVSICGVGTAGFGVAGDLDSIDLAALAASRAIADSGLKTKDVDGLFTASAYHFMPALSLSEYLGINPRVADGTMIGGSSFVGYILSAMMALATRQCDVALIAYGSNQRSGKRPALTEASPFEAEYRPRNPITPFALAASRHMHEFGTTREQLAAVAVAARRWAALNPDAFQRDPLAISDVLSSKMISDPLSVRDCCLITDGAGALVLKRTDERERSTRNKPVHVLGAGLDLAHRYIAGMTDMTRTGAARSGHRAYEMAGVTAADIDVVELYDAFTISTLMFLEDLGFCKKGEGGPFVAAGHIDPGGLLPVNTNGGGLSCCHPGMYGIFTLIEAVVQLRGQAGARQVDGAELALSHGNGGAFLSQASVVLGTSSTL